MISLNDVVIAELIRSLIAPSHVTLIKSLGYSKHYSTNIAHRNGGFVQTLMIGLKNDLKKQIM